MKSKDTQLFHIGKYTEAVQNINSLNDEEEVSVPKEEKGEIVGRKGKK